jgi:integrase
LGQKWANGYPASLFGDLNLHRIFYEEFAMAQIQKRGDGWRCRIRRTGFPPVCKTFPTKHAAEVWVRTLEGEMDRGTFIDRTEAEKNTLADLLQRYKREVTHLKRGARNEEFRINHLLREPIVLYRISVLSAGHVAAWRDERLKAVSGDTCIRDLSLISHVIETARREWGIMLSENPLKFVRKPKPNPSRARRLRDGEESRLLEALAVTKPRDATGCFSGESARNPMVKPIVELALQTAMRQSELTGLRWDNVDLTRRVAVLEMTKNGERRAVPLSTRAVEILSALPKSESGLVFCGVSSEAVKRSFRRATHRAGLVDLRFHDLRHEATSGLFVRGLNIMEVASVTGHKTLQMLKRYTHFQAEELARKLA